MAGLTDLLDVISKAGVVGLLAAILWGGSRPDGRAWWIFGWAHRAALSDRDRLIDELREERDRLFEIILTSNSTLRESTDLTATVIGQKGHR